MKLYDTFIKGQSGSKVMRNPEPMKLYDTLIHCQSGSKPVRNR